ncbi:Rha family transcriptional regulator [Campylobacter sp. VBCF_06 NA8]|uniref:Rha family transcriptional regulator n=1 Tax=Campylobacter sp. VBCF_06 NA8 TaxID=2983822 RepID=UPI0022EA02E6|nr:Rha family transcriptional regulator [Campylobacter sp. VBCF_06 NA8]MDA3046736.1 Rha family transcriptional regulator [Campylobacter sp. VBCF_06 NA8]
MSAIINNVCVNFEVVENQIFTNSLQIAEVFEKRHDNILQMVDKLPNDDFKGSNFIKGEYIDKKGEIRPLYNLTKDGFMLLVMGFTGTKAYKFKVAFINAFNEMQKELERLRERERVDKIANLEMVQISQNKHFQNVINGYKSQIARKNQIIKEQEHGLRDLDMIAQDKFMKGFIEYASTKKKKLNFIAGALQFLQHFNYRFMEHLQIYALDNGDDRSRINEMMGSCG